jgi:hypothetical protein
MRRFYRAVGGIVAKKLPRCQYIVLRSLAFILDSDGEFREEKTRRRAAVMVRGLLVVVISLEMGMVLELMTVCQFRQTLASFGYCL